MKITKLNQILPLAMFISIGMLSSCGNQQNNEEQNNEQQSQENMETNANASDPEYDYGETVEAIFPQGEQGPAENFTGEAYNYMLVKPDSTYTSAVGNVFFKPGARSNWHTHPAGQILIITSGKGYHQIEGEAIQIMKEGDVIECPPNKKHWHGASKDTGLQQMFIVPNTEKGIVNWMEPVTDEQYNAAE